MKKITVLSTEFSCAHFYAQTKWTNKKNKKEFGLCFSDYGHGHNYSLELHINSEYSKKFQVVLKKISSYLDHKHLNYDLPYFHKIIPTTENIAVFILDKIEDKYKKDLYSVKLKEMNSIWVEVKL